MGCTAGSLLLLAPDPGSTVGAGHLVAAGVVEDLDPGDAAEFLPEAGGGVVQDADRGQRAPALDLGVFCGPGLLHLVPDQVC